MEKKESEIISRRPQRWWVRLNCIEKVQYLDDDLTQEFSNFSHRNLHVEYLQGGTAADVASQFGRNEKDRVVRSYTWGIVSTLSYLHAMDFVHYNVKWKNVLLDSGFIAGVAKRADFGSSKLFSGNEKMIFPRGSTLWMALEVVRGETHGPESDVWSLGCTVIEMVTRKPAWEDCGVDTECRIAFSDSVTEFLAELS
ncbi:hypothetical protein NE237_027350 [Protea cynaroides]|uniref:Protein kinase domain-containing protein n=1 Tax=Protea cynaroides TaxID=273540 RepID=A0A9Q0GMT4_9MAGN|nr:hypothetical protein NE237_027350 [Protea cynaroides]